MDLIKLQYPIGKFLKPAVIKPEDIEHWISEIELFPSRLTRIVSQLNDKELDYNYRPQGGWNIRQVLHHCADSHMNGFIRFKLALSEEVPVIKPYFEAKWSLLEDVSSAPISDSLKILDGLHHRWTILLRSLNESDLNREFVHPEHGKRFNLKEYIGNYAWHSNHHLAHIEQALKYKGEFEL
jgi:hypothetical protein